MTPPRKKGLGTSAIVAIVVASVLLLTCVGGAGLVALLLPALGKARQQAREVVVISNLRQTMTGLSSYGMQFDQLPPADQLDQVVAQQTGISTAVLFDSPRIEGSAKELVYAPPKYEDGTLAGFSDIDNPSIWVILYEDPALLPPTTDRVAAAYMDGHVVMISRAQLAAELAAQAAPVERKNEPPR